MATKGWDRELETDAYSMKIRRGLDEWTHCLFSVERDEPTQQFNVFARECVVVKFDPSAPKVQVRVGDEYMTIPDNYGLFVPNFSIVDWVLPRGSYQIHSSAHRSFDGLDLSGPPFCFPLEKELTFSSKEQLLDVCFPNDKCIKVGRRIEFSPTALKIKKLIDQNFSSDVKIASFAAKLGITREALSRNFAQNFGIPPARYRTALRISESISQLVVDNQNVTDAGLASGYDDIGLFIKQFRNFHDTTPGKFRNIPEEGGQCDR